MNSPHLFRHIAIALFFALIASVGSFVLVPLIGFSLTTAMALPAISLLYLLFLFSQASDKTGRITCMMLWSAMTLGIWVFNPSIDIALVLHLGAIWLIRSLYFHNGIVGPLLDLVLSASSVAVALWCYFHSGSVFLSVWSLFLTQAFFVAIPPALTQTPSAEKKTTDNTRKFNEASASADAALRQLYTR